MVAPAVAAEVQVVSAVVVHMDDIPRPARHRLMARQQQRQPQFLDHGSNGSLALVEVEVE